MNIESCPICGSPFKYDRTGTHAATYVYECGAEVDCLLNGDHPSISLKCGEKRVDYSEVFKSKRKSMDEVLDELIDYVGAVYNGDPKNMSKESADSIAQRIESIKSYIKKK